MIELIIGICLRIISALTLRENFSLYILFPNKIVDVGIYRFIRHPAYLGSLIMLFGAARMALGFYGAIVITWVMLNFLVDRIQREEAVMFSKFRDKYIAYCLKTKKLIPFIW